MANLIIKSSADDLVLKGSGGNSAITVAAAGTTTFAQNATLSGTANNLGTSTAGTLSSGLTFPAGHVIQTVSDSYWSGESDSLLSASTLTRVETGSNVYNWKGTINNVAASSWVKIDMSFGIHVSESSAADMGAAFGIFRNEDGEIYSDIAGNAHRGWYLHTVTNGSNTLDHYSTVSLHMVDKSAATGTNIYYLSYAVHGGSAVTINSSSTSGVPYICTLQEIQQ